MCTITRVWVVTIYYNYNYVHIAVLELMYCCCLLETIISSPKMLQLWH